MPYTYSVRPIEQQDFEEIIRIDNEIYSYFDEELETKTVRSFALTKKKLLDLMGQSNTRTLIVEEDESCKAVAYMIYEIHKDRFEVVNFGFREEHPESGRELLKKIEAKLEKNERKTFAEVNMRDYSHRQLLPFTEKDGWDVKLCPNHFPDGGDSWKCTFQTKSAVR